MLFIHRNNFRKFLIPALLLCFIISIASGFNLQCETEYENFTCVVTDLQITKKDEKINSVNVANIEDFYVYDQIVKYFPSNLGEKFKGLISVRIHRSKLIEISRSDFKGIENLKALDLGNNELTEIGKNIFDDLHLLEKLNLNDNNINTINEGALRRLKNLKSINLGSNHLRKVDVNLFKYCKELEVVSLNNNFLQELPSHLFTNLKQLKRLEVNVNELKNLQNQLFERNELLEELNVENNVITSIGSEIKKRIQNLVNHKFRYNICTGSLKEGYSKEDLINVLDDKCKPDNSTRVQWLLGEVREMNRFKREDEIQIKCFEDEIEKSKSNMNNFCEELNSEIKMSKINRKTASIEEGIKSEITKIPGQIKETLANDLKKLITIENTLKDKFNALDITNADLNTKLQAIDKIPNQVKNSLTELIEKQIKSTIKSEFESFRNTDELKTSLIDGLKEIIKNGNVELSAKPKECNIFKLSYDLIQQVVQKVPTKDEMEKFIHSLNNINDAIDNKQSEITISFKEFFDPDDYPETEMNAFMDKVKNQCSSNLTFKTDDD